MKITLVTRAIPMGRQVVVTNLRAVSRRLRGRHSNRGPEAVLRSAVRGLTLCGVQVTVNPARRDLSSVVVVLQGLQALEQAIELRKRGEIKVLLAGPNLTDAPRLHGELLSSPWVDQVLVPSKWVERYYALAEPRLEDRMSLWFAGVDTSFWSGATTYRDQILILDKASDQESRSVVREVSVTLQSRGLVRTIQYGKFTQQEFRSWLSQAKLLVYVSRSESQSIALAEAWSMDVPTLVWRCEGFEHHGEWIPSSSAPYLSESTGAFFKDVNQLSGIVNECARHSSDKRSPRAWVDSNMTDEHSGRRLLDIVYEALPR